MSNNKYFYDKWYGENCCFSNTTTKKISIDNLYNEDFKVYLDDHALNYYNNKVKNTLSPDILLYNFCHIELYSKYIDSNEIICLVVDIDHTILSDRLFTKNNMSKDEINFLHTLMYYHDMYTCYYNNISHIDHDTDLTISKNKDYLAEKLDICVDYTGDYMIDQPKNINLKLYNFQKCNIYWMLQKELNPKTIYFSIYEEIKIGDIYYNLIAKKFCKKEDRQSLTFYGGALIDEVGRGKTIQMIALALSNPAKDISYFRNDKEKYPNNYDDSYLYSRATFIICPTHLCKQWRREIENNISNIDSIKIISLLTKREHDKYCYQDYLDADFVIVTFSFLANKSYTMRWTSRISSRNNYHTYKWSNEERKNVKLLFKNDGTDLINNGLTSLRERNIMMHNIHWHRIIVDEFHEGYTGKKGNTHIPNLLPLFKSTYRWLVSATPFIADIGHIVSFMTNYTNKDYDNIFIDDDIIDYISNNCFRKNTEESVKNIEGFSLPPIEEHVKWLKFTPTERMMYNAHLADPNNNKFGKYLRQLCCHPQLADETKHALLNCKSLEDIDKMMVKHYKDEEEKAKQNVNKIKDRILRTKKKIVMLLEDTFRDYNYKKHILATYDIDIDNPIYYENTDEINVNTDVSGYSSILKRYDESLQKAYIKLTEAENILEGKSTTYKFFTNVMDRLKKTVNKDHKNELVIEVPDNCENILDYYADLSDDEFSDDEDDDIETCGICLEDIPENSTGVTKCGHLFCYQCAILSLNKNGSCPYCKQKLTKQDVFLVSCEWKKKTNETNKDIEFNEIVNKVGTKMAHLIQFIRNTDKHSIIFSQWDDLLKRVGLILTEYGINNVFCKGNCHQRDKAIRDFNNIQKDSKKDIKVIMLSSEKSAAGTNLTKAQNIIFLDPIYGSYKYRTEQEKQAIGRAHRMGQNNTVNVIRFIILDTVEEEIYNINLQQTKKDNDN